MVTYCTPCPLHYGGCSSFARKKGELRLLGLLWTRQMASCFWFRSLPWGCARNMLIFCVCLCCLSTAPLPPPLKHVLRTSRVLRGYLKNHWFRLTFNQCKNCLSRVLDRCLPRILKLCYVPGELILSLGGSNC